MHELTSLDEGLMRPSIEPSITAAEHFNKEFTPLEIDAINVGNFQFAAI